MTLVLIGRLETLSTVMGGIAINHLEEAQSRSSHFLEVAFPYNVSIYSEVPF